MPKRKIIRKNDNGLSKIRKAFNILDGDLRFKQESDDLLTYYSDNLIHCDKIFDLSIYPLLVDNIYCVAFTIKVREKDDDLTVLFDFSELFDKKYMKRIKTAKELAEQIMNRGAKHLKGVCQTYGSDFSKQIDDELKLLRIN